MNQTIVIFSILTSIGAFASAYFIFQWAKLSNAASVKSARHAGWAMIMVGVCQLLTATARILEILW